MDITAALGTVSKAIGGFVAGAIVSWLMKHNIVIADALPDAIEVLISGLVTFVIVYFSPKNKAPVTPTTKAKVSRHK